jgi:hypothetical protein
MLAADSTLTGCDGCAKMTTSGNFAAYNCQVLSGIHYQEVYRYDDAV